MNDTPRIEQKRITSYQHEDMYEDEIDLISLFNVLWRQRWIMLIIVVCTLILSIGYCFVSTPTYEITAQIRPGISGYDQNNTPVRSWDVNDIQAWFKNKSYTPALRKISNELNNGISGINVKVSATGNIVTIKNYWPDSENGEKILKRIIDIFGRIEDNNLNSDLKVSKANIERQVFEKEQILENLIIERERLKDTAVREEQALNVDITVYEQEMNVRKKEISLIAADILLIDQQIEQIENKLNLLHKRLESIQSNKAEIQKAKESIRKQINLVTKNAEELMHIRKKIISENPNSVDLLMHSNIVQQNINYSNSLQQHILNYEKEMASSITEETKVAKEIEDLNTTKFDLLAKKNKQLPIRETNLLRAYETLASRSEQRKKAGMTKINDIKINNNKELSIKSQYAQKEIDALKTKLSNLSLVEVVQSPFSSENPVKPNRKKIVILSLLIGCFIAFATAFLREFWDRNKKQITSTD